MSNSIAQCTRLIRQMGKKTICYGNWLILPDIWPHRKKISWFLDNSMSLKNISVDTFFDPKAEHCFLAEVEIGLFRWIFWFFNQLKFIELFNGHWSIQVQNTFMLWKSERRLHKKPQKTDFMYLQMDWFELRFRTTSRLKLKLIFRYHSA